MPIRIVVVDDEFNLRREIRLLIEANPDLECVGEFADAESVLAQISKLQARIVLMDIRLPGLSGIDCTDQIKRLYPEIQVLMLTVFDDYELIFQSLKAGATGYLLKKFMPSRLVDSIRELHSGGSPMSPSIARKVVQTFSVPSTEENPIEKLSFRERQILEGLAKGLRYKEIADELGLSDRTVCAHVRNIYEKLQVHSRNEAVRKMRK